MTLTVPVFLTALAMVGGLLMIAMTFGRWAGELQTMMKRHDEEIVMVRQRTHNQGDKIIALETRADGLEQDVGQLFHGRRRGDDGRGDE